MREILLILLAVACLVSVILFARARWLRRAVLRRTSADAARRIHPLMHIPVPWVFVLIFLAGFGLQRLAPLTLRSADAIFVGRVAGIVLTAAGVLLAFSGLGIFRAARTTTIPFETPSKLVTWGPYRFTRNPMYSGLTLIYIGVAGMQVQLWPLVLLPLLILYIDRIVIPVEEARLREVFGDAYNRSCARVRRWI